MVTVDFTAQGADQWTKPAGVTEFTVEVTGGGGAGRGAGGLNTQGGGGGGGAAASRLFTGQPSAATDYDLFVGAGGVGQSGPAVPGGTGSASWFDSTSSVFAAPGVGAQDQGGGAGGLASASVGDTTVSGQNGGTAGGQNGVGGNAASVGTLTGGTGGPFPGSAGNPGGPGTQPGGGGSGSWSVGFGGQTVGGDGATGWVRVTYDEPSIPIPEGDGLVTVASDTAAAGVAIHEGATDALSLATVAAAGMTVHEGTGATDATLETTAIGSTTHDGAGTLTSVTETAATGLAAMAGTGTLAGASETVSDGATDHTGDGTLTGTSDTTAVGHMTPEGPTGTTQLTATLTTTSQGTSSHNGTTTLTATTSTMGDGTNTTGEPPMPDLICPGDDGGLSCCWPLDLTDCCPEPFDGEPDPEQIALIEKAAARASAMLTAFSGYRVGLCTAQLRPLGACPTCRTRCCGEPDAITLIGLRGMRVADVETVTLDGDVLDPTEWAFDVESQRLYRIGDRWPRIDERWDTTGGLLVDVTLGSSPDAWARSVAATLVCEIVKSCVGEKCRLPANTTRVTRQGVSIDLTPTELRYLLPEVAGWVEQVNPAGARMPTRVMSPDLTPIPAQRVGGCCGR